MKIFFTTALLLIAAMCFAQKQNVYLLKNNGQYVQNRDSADYIRVVSDPDSGSTLYNVAEYYPNGKRKLIGKSSVIDPPKFEGLCVIYYHNGNRKSALTYKSGMLAGDQYQFYPNGKPYLAIKYPDTVNINNQLQNDYLITAEYDSLGTPLVTDGNGYYKQFDGKFKTVTEQGNLKNGKRDGTWKGMSEDSSLRFTEIYHNGVFVSGMSVGNSHDTVKYTTREVEPAYKGGMQAFYDFLGKKVKYPQYERENNIQGKVILSFVVEKDGKISNVKVIKNVSYGIDSEALRVLNLTSDWIPGSQFGRPVRVIYTIPISFALGN